MNSIEFFKDNDKFSWKIVNFLPHAEKVDNWPDLCLKFENFPEFWRAVRNEAFFTTSSSAVIVLYDNLTGIIKTQTSFYDHEWMALLNRIAAVL